MDQKKDKSAIKDPNLESEDNPDYNPAVYDIDNTGDEGEKGGQVGDEGSSEMPNNWSDNDSEDEDKSNKRQKKED